MPHDDQPSDRQGEEVLSAARESSLERAVPVYLALLMAIGTVVALLLLYELRHVVLLVFISLLFAAAASRPAALLQRLRIPEGISVVVIYLLTLALFGLIVWFIVPPLLSQIANFGDDLPSYIERFKSIGRTYDRIQREYPQLHSFDDQLSSIGGRVVAAAGRWLTTLPTKLFALFLDVLSVVVMSIMIVTSRRRILRLILMLVGPRYRTQTRAILVEMWLQLGHYLRAKVIEMTIIGGITFVVLYLLHMPFSLAIGDRGGAG